MTPTQLDHLKRIDAHLERLLDIASKRTPGEWFVEQTDTTNWIGTLRRDGRKIDEVVCDTDREDLKPYALARNDNNADFIAACAGNAEAGWRATRAAIAMFGLVESEPILLESILAAFPLETPLPSVSG